MRTRPKASRRPARCRPAVALLEDRRLLSPPTIIVDPTNPGAYHTIGAAVTAYATNAVPFQAGATIQVEPATYQEQVYIPGNLSGLILQGDPNQSQKPVIQAPASAPGGPDVRVAIATGVTIKGFTIQGGTGNGIQVDDGGSATILNNHITSVGVGIRVEYAGATIQNNTVDNYQQTGISVVGAGPSSADVEQNTITGLGPVSSRALNGIEIGFGASALVKQNNVSQNIFSPRTIVASGITLYQAGAVTVTQNTLTADDVGITSFGTANPVITLNNVSGSTWDGIELRDSTTGATVSQNVSNNNQYDGIYLDNGSSNNTITNNTVNNNGEYGIEVNGTGAPSVNNTISPNSASGNGLGDVFVYNSTSASVSFLGTDATTQGNWRSAYGHDGYDIPADNSATNPVLPPYAQVALSGGGPAAWTTSTSDVRALQNAANSGRISSAFFGNTMTFDVNFTDGQAHKLALYTLDWDGYGGGRSERIDVLDAANNAVLSTQTISSFGQGEYLVWTVTGHVKLVVTNLNANSNAVVNGLFFG
jgi:parallel beta-helix repeat protein